ncbi:Sucrase/ferredoxin-like-domain-containing protein [Apiospora arundinis]
MTTKSPQHTASIPTHNSPPPPPPPSSKAPPPTSPPRQPPLKQKMALGFRSLVEGARKALTPLSGGTPASQQEAASARSLFPATDPTVDGDACLHDCDSCHIAFPRGFKIDEADLLYGHIKGWSTHMLVATGKSDWVRDVEDEKGSVMQALGGADKKPANGRLMLSASNMPVPNSHAHNDAERYAAPTTVLLLPAFRLVENVTPAAVPMLVERFIDVSPTNASPLAPVTLPERIPLSLTPSDLTTKDEGSASLPSASDLLSRPCPHSALILLCSQKTRDARCGQSAPLLRKELERHLRPLGLFRDLDDERPGGVGIYFISHVGGHKYSANMMVYRRPDAFGVDNVQRAQHDKESGGANLKPVQRKKVVEVKPVDAEAEEDPTATKGEKESGGEEDVGAGQCIWLARVKPEDCENIVKYTVLQGKVVKPDTQLRGGFDRSKGLMSW